MIDNVYDGKLLFKKDGIWRTATSKEKLCELICDTIDFYKNMADDYREEANKTRDEVMAEVRDEMRQKDEEIARMPFLFNEVESNNFKAFEHKHCEKGCGKFNEGFSISFVGTGVGMIYKVKCNNCGEEEDITDLESW